MVWVLICFVFMLGAVANWIWTMTSYDATPMERLMPMSIPNEAMFGAMLSVAVFLLSVHVASEVEDDPDEKVEKGVKPVLREFGKEFQQACMPGLIFIGKILAFCVALVVPLVLAHWLFKPSKIVSTVVSIVLLAILLAAIAISDKVLPGGVNAKLTKMARERRGIPGWLFGDLFRDDGTASKLDEGNSPSNGDSLHDGGSVESKAEPR